jgi:hypothetical protein
MGRLVPATTSTPGTSLRVHHGLVERRASHEVAEDNHAVVPLSGRRNDICQLLGELACLVLVERDNIELLLRASDHLDGAVETNGKVSVTSEHKSDHASPPLTGFFITPHRLEDFWFQQGTSLLRPSCFSVTGYYHVSTNATLQDLRN